MRKKTILIILMMIISIGAIMLGKSFQNSANTKEQISQNNNIQAAPIEENKQSDKVEDNNQKTDNNASSQSSSVKSNNEDSKSTEQQKTAKTVTDSTKNKKTDQQKTVEKKPNLIITDTISGKQVFAKAVTFNGETAAQATKKALDGAKISYKVSGFGETIYFSSINGLRERGAGAASGWCFYVNGKKLSISSGAYKLNKDDILEWKYLKDGVAD